MAFDQVNAWLDDITRLGVPFSSVIIRKNHEVIFRAQRGPDEKKVFLFSCSKPITVTGAMRLFEQGAFKMDDPVSRFLPAFADCFVLQDGKPRKLTSPMTMWHLFTMSGGLDYGLKEINPFLAEAAQIPGADTVSIVSALPKRPLNFEPGDQFRYSLCHDVLGAVIQVITGMTFGDFMKMEIFDPLGMKDTSFAAHPAGLAPLYRFDAKTRTFSPAESECPYILSENYHSGGAGVSSTVEDLSLFTDALAMYGEAANGYRLLKPETVDYMRTEQLRGRLKHPEFGCAAGPGYSYGLGVRTLITKEFGAASNLGEFGWDGAAGCYELMDPACGLSVAFIMQSYGWTSILPGEPFHARLRDGAYQ